MNHLAHLHLAERTPRSRLGNLMGDFVRGRAVLATLDPEVRIGVLLHRRIDGFTDNHPAAREAAALLRPTWGRFAPMIVDVTFDHCLARSWERWESEPLRAFADGCYADLAAQRHLMPPLMQRVCEGMERGDWLAAIRTVGGLEEALGRLSSRLKRHGLDLRPAVDEIASQESAFGALFGSAYADLRDFAREEVASLRLGDAETMW